MKIGMEPGMEPVDWSSGAPRSLRHGDVYHSLSGALAQTRHVFLGGCDLPRAWADRPTWRLFETGFGLGLNFLATWLAWRDDPHRPQRLVFESIEAWPVSPDDIRRAAAAEPALALLGETLAAALAATPAWRPPGADPGTPAATVHARFDEGRVELIIRVADAAVLASGNGGGVGVGVGVGGGGGGGGDDQPVDSIFLDGFSPARNPAIWSTPVLTAVAARLRPGGQLATWTVAAAVRQALRAAGLVIDRRPGLPPKRDCLVAWRAD